MTQELSSNTQAILLLTAPLIVGRGTKSSDLLSPSEYKRLAIHLREIQHQPADLVSPNAVEAIRACKLVIDESRLQRLLERGFLLSQAIERWQTRAIWVVSRADSDYPSRLKARLREDAPAVIYGCGDISLLDSGGLAVVGSRNVDDSLIDYTMGVGRLAALAGKTLISGGARGIDQAAMRGALEEGGKVCGVLADGLEKTIMNREQRNMLLNGQLVLISPYDPSARFNVGNAMQRNKLIYALADTSLVVSSDFNKGGTWAGAVEQLDKLKYVPIFVRATGESSMGLDGLLKKGALSWPDPQDVNSLEAVFNEPIPSQFSSRQESFSLPLNDDVRLVEDLQTEPAAGDVSLALQINGETSVPLDAASSNHSPTEASEERLPPIPEVAAPIGEADQLSQPETSPAETVFESVRTVIQHLLSVPMKDAEVAAALNVTKQQAKTWLQRLVDEGVLEKKRAVGYVIKQQKKLL